MASEQFSLCWDNFHKNMSSGLNALLENEDLVDVTLAVDGKFFKAHQMVLSVCSPYFKELFKANPCQHPIVFLKDVSYVAISDLLQFMYQGEVQVSQDNLTTFIKTAEALQIKGLTGDGNGTEADSEPPQDKPAERHVEETYKPMPRPKKVHPAPIVTTTPAIKKPRLSLSSNDQSSSAPITKAEPAIESSQFKVEPFDPSQSVTIPDDGDETFGDETLDDTTVDDNEDYSMMEGEEPQAGTSTDGAGEGQVKRNPMDNFFDTFGRFIPTPSLHGNVQPIKEEHSSFNTSYDEIMHLAGIRNNEGYALTNFNRTVCKKEEIELKSLLSQWNQEHLADTLLAEKVYVSTLEIINRHHVRRLLKTYDIGSMGTEILFEHNLEKWRESIGKPLLPYAISDTSTSTPALSEIIIPPISLRETASRDKHLPNSSNNTISISLDDVLNESPRGKMLVEFYSQFSRFQEEQRCSLISLIAHYFEEKNLKMTLAASHKMENEILERFPSEKLEYYRTSKRGRIYNKYTNLAQSFKNAVSKHIRNEKEVMKNTRHEKAFEPERDGEICLKALKFDNLSDEEFDSTWKACCHFRLEFIKSTNVIEVFEKWPFFKTPSGYRLIDIDFKTAFENKDGLLSEWSQNVDKITLFLTTEQHIKDRNIKGVLEHMKKNATLTENGKYTALIWALHGYLVPTNKVVKKDATGKKITTKFTIKDSQESVIYVGSSQQEVEEYISHLKKTKSSLQPSIYATGKDIFSIENIFVQFNEIRYKFTNILSALDICFKIIYLFDLDFPGESIMFYTFLESYFYKFKPSSKYAKVHILSEYLST